MQQSGERVIARSLRRYVDGAVLHLRITGALLRRRDTKRLAKYSSESRPIAVSLDRVARKCQTRARDSR